LTIYDIDQQQYGFIQSQVDNIPPSSLAITSALSSFVVYAIELFEFPKEIPIAYLSPGVVPFADAPSAAILSVL
jgi:hypothetical protein